MVDLQALKALVERMTPGPWRAEMEVSRRELTIMFAMAIEKGPDAFAIITTDSDEAANAENVRRMQALRPEAQVVPVIATVGKSNNSAHNLAAIVEVMNAAPALIAVVEAAQALQQSYAGSLAAFGETDAGSLTADDIERPEHQAILQAFERRDAAERALFVALAALDAPEGSGE